MHHRQVLCALILWTVCVSSWNTVTASGRDNPTYACESYNRQNRTQNRCEGINDIIVEQRVQESTNKKLWCIVLNNENNVYNGQNLIINFTARGFGVATLFAERLSMTPSSAVFKLNAGVNTIALYGLNKKSPFPRIKSLKLEGDELCSNDGRGRSFNEDIPDQLALDSELYPKHDNFRFVNHCRDKSETLTTTKWCPGVEIPATSFIVEKFKLHDEDYWCMNFETETNDPSQKKLDFLLSNGDKELAWNPPDAYISCVGAHGEFYVGDKTTTIVFGPSKRTNILPDINSLTINGKDVCDHYRNPNPPAPRFGQNTQKPPQQVNNYTPTVPPYRQQDQTPPTKRPYNEFKPPVPPLPNPDLLPPSRQLVQHLIPPPPINTPFTKQPKPNQSNNTPPQSNKCRNTQSQYDENCRPESTIPPQSPRQPNLTLKPSDPYNPNQNNPHSPISYNNNSPPQSPEHCNPTRNGGAFGNQCQPGQNNKPQTPTQVYPSHRPLPPTGSPAQPGKCKPAYPGAPVSPQCQIDQNGSPQNPSNSKPPYTPLVQPGKCKPLYPGGPISPQCQLPQNELPLETPNDVDDLFPPNNPKRTRPNTPSKPNSPLPSQPGKCKPLYPGGPISPQCQATQFSTEMPETPYDLEDSFPPNNPKRTRPNTPTDQIVQPQNPFQRTQAIPPSKPTPNLPQPGKCKPLYPGGPISPQCQAILASTESPEAPHDVDDLFPPNNPKRTNPKSKPQNDQITQPQSPFQKALLPPSSQNPNSPTTNPYQPPLPNTPPLNPGKCKPAQNGKPGSAQCQPDQIIQPQATNQLPQPPQNSYRTNPSSPPLSAQPGKCIISPNRATSSPYCRNEPSSPNSISQPKRPVFYETPGHADPSPHVLATDPSFKFLNDCLKKRTSVPYTTWCNDRAIPSSIFIAEKFKLNGMDYWCFNFEPDQKSQSGQQVLTIKSNDQYKLFSWLPGEAVHVHEKSTDAYQNTFYLSSKRTTIEFSPFDQNITVPNIESIQINGQDVCEYFKNRNEPKSTGNNIPAPNFRLTNYQPRDSIIPDKSYVPPTNGFPSGSNQHLTEIKPKSYPSHIQNSNPRDITKSYVPPVSGSTQPVTVFKPPTYPTNTGNSYIPPTRSTYPIRDASIPDVTRTYVPAIHGNTPSSSSRSPQFRTPNYQSQNYNSQTNILPTQPPSKLPESRAPILTQDPAFKYLNDCLDKRTSKKFTTYCEDRIPSSVFLIEKFNLKGQDYWCFNFPSQNGGDSIRSQKKRQVLSMTFSGESICPITWIPDDASSSNDPLNSASTSIFKIGQKETTIAVGPEENKTTIPNIDAIKIEGKDICEYYKHLSSIA